MESVTNFLADSGAELALDLVPIFVALLVALGITLFVVFGEKKNGGD